MKTFLLAILFSLAAFGLTQEDAPKVKLVLDTKAAKPGAAIKGKVLITFAPGLHGYQNPPSQDYMIPVKLESDSKDIKVKVTYPLGEPMKVGGETEAANVYVGEVAFPIVVTLPKRTGVVNVALKLSYQQCNDTACFPPALTTVAQKLTIPAAKKTPLKPVKKKKKGG